MHDGPPPPSTLHVYFSNLFISVMLLLYNDTRFYFQMSNFGTECMHGVLEQKAIKKNILKWRNFVVNTSIYIYRVYMSLLTYLQGSVFLQG